MTGDGQLLREITMNEKIKKALEKDEITISVEEFTRLLNGVEVQQLVMTKELFSDLSGITTVIDDKKHYGIIEGWIRRGYVKTIKIGRRVMIYLPSLKEDIEDSLNS